MYGKVRRLSFSDEAVADTGIVLSHRLGAGLLQPCEADCADRSSRVIDHGNQIGAVLEHIPGVVAVVAIATNDTLQPFSVDSQCSWQARHALRGERLEPRLLDRLAETCTDVAFPLGGARSSLRVRFEDPRLGLPRYPYPEID